MWLVMSCHQRRTKMTLIIVLSALAFLWLTYKTLKRTGFRRCEDMMNYSRFDCAELDQEHDLKKGRCVKCGKNFLR